MYFNVYPENKQPPEKKFLLGILGTVYPGYLSELIKTANRARNNPAQEEDKEDKILIKDEIWSKLESEPFFTSKIIFTLILFRIEGQGYLYVEVENQAEKAA